MKGKYTNPVHFAVMASYRTLLRLIIGRLVSWRKQDKPEEGYTVIIGCLSSLPALIIANLRRLACQETEHLREVLLVVDGDGPPDLNERVAGALGAIPYRIIKYSALQSSVTRLIRSPWVNLWLSWAQGIAETQTRHAVLHDLDAMLLKSDFLKQRYASIRKSRAHYQGVRYYSGNGVCGEDELVTTFEMFFDVSFVRARYKPIHLFNHVTFRRGRTVDFDTFLWVQAQGGEREIIGAGLEELVHPSQLICQFAYHVNGDRRVPIETHNLMLLPYFLFLGGETDPMARLTGEMGNARGSRVTFFGRDLELGCLRPAHVTWLAGQASHLERALYGDVRSEVRAYLDAFQNLTDRTTKSRQVDATGSVGEITQPRRGLEADGGRLIREDTVPDRYCQ
ncbi:MAG: hypothetical protein GWN84_03730 [Gammaproteobacteria bacterium]|nr:hypothetical protein [Gammaproteobacteria bacterium]NIR90093.1 hypothetical protein [Gammaproteobacteria bacterium]NIU03298.1 hypothetical protein [Gammaproteobacteria bacterium]NIV50792.1 hypothetical protein [Gammaproteobacteria bacterium]NIV75377.1 hypothetical protein [Gammaproteobacteria bacterium]